MLPHSSRLATANPIQGPPQCTQASGVSRRGSSLDFGDFRARSMRRSSIPEFVLRVTNCARVRRRDAAAAYTAKALEGAASRVVSERCSGAIPTTTQALWVSPPLDLAPHER